MEIKIWGITEGPISVEDFDEDYDVPEGSTHYMVCTVEIDGDLEEDMMRMNGLSILVRLLNHYYLTWVAPLDITRSFCRDISSELNSCCR